MFNLRIWAAHLLVPDGPFLAITAASQHRQKHNSSTSVPKHRTISPFLRTVYHSSVDQLFILSWRPCLSLPMSKICKDLYLLVLTSQVDSSLQRCIPSMYDDLSTISVLHTFPALSFLVPFGTGSSMVL